MKEFTCALSVPIWEDGRIQSMQHVPIGKRYYNWCGGLDTLSSSGPKQCYYPLADEGHCSINTKTGEVVMEALHDGYSLDFPCVNPRFYSRKARHVFFTAATQEKFTSAPLQVNDFPAEAGQQAMGSLRWRGTCKVAGIAAYLESRQCISL
jgi:hypothetical protein